MTTNSISGIVRDEANQEVANATVALIKQNGGSIVEYTQTDSNGFYEFFFHQEANATEEDWHVAVYDDVSPIFNSFSKPYVSAALNLGIGSVSATTSLGGVQYSEDSGTYTPGANFLSGNITTTIDTSYNDVLVFSDSFEDGDYTDNWNIKYNTFGNPGMVEVNNNFATDGSFSAFGNTNASSSAGLQTIQTFSGSAFRLTWDMRLTRYEDANAMSFGLVKDNGDVNNTGGDSPKIQWSFSERENTSNLLVADSQGSVSRNVGFIPNLNTTYNMRLDFINGIADLYVNGSSTGFPTLTAKNISATDLSIMLRWGETDGYVDNVQLRQ